MGRFIATPAFIALMISAGITWADNNGEANKLFVEASKLVNSVESEGSVVGKLDALEKALVKLNEIVDDHPSSEVAAKLVRGQDTGGISLEYVADAALRARVMYYEGGRIPENYAEQFVRMFNAVEAN